MGQINCVCPVKLNALCAVFRCPYPLLVVGHEDGVVRTYELPTGGSTGALSRLKVWRCEVGFELCTQSTY